jgi:chromosome partitioning protein
MTKVYAVAIRKGGSGKTTTAVNLAKGLEQRGKRVLLIDLDPQGDAGKHLGIKTRELKTSINTLFTVVGTNPLDIIQPTNFGFDIIPATKDLDITDRSMVATQTGLLRPIVEALAPRYDYIILDTRPAQSILTINALVAATHVIIPMQAEYLAMDGLIDTFTDINNVKNGLNPNLNVIGILPTLVRNNTNLAKAVLEDVGEHYHQLLLQHNGQIISIRNSIKLSEAVYDGQPGITYAPDNEAAKDYIKLAEVIDAKE